MMPGIKKIWVLTGMTLQIVDKPLTLAMKIMVLTIYSTQWSSQDIGCIFRKHEHKEGLSYI
jgi:hypothetical protein